MTKNDCPLLQYKELHGLVLYGHVLIIILKITFLYKLTQTTGHQMWFLYWVERGGNITPDMIFIH